MANRYWVGGAASWDGTAGTKWALTSGGAGGQAVPTTSDDVFFDAASGAVTITASGAIACHNFTCTGFTGTFAGGLNTFTINGSSTLGGGTYSNSHTWFYNSGSAETITSNAKTTSNTYSFNGTGSWTLQDNLNCGANSITLTAGSLDTNGKTVTAGSILGSNSNTRSLTLGASTINISSTSGWSFATTTGLTFSAGTSTINFTGAANFAGGGLTYNILNWTNSGNNLNMTGANTFAQLSVSCSANSDLLFAANQIISGALSLTGSAAADQRLHVHSSVGGIQRTLTANSTITLTNVDFYDIIGSGVGTWSGTSVADGGNTSGIAFTSPVTRYWVGNGGNWNSTTKWSTSTGGASGASVPLCHDTVIIDANSISSGSQTITITPSRQALARTITCTGVLNSPNIATPAVSYWFGSVTLATGMTMSGSAFTFVNRSTAIFTTAGVTVLGFTVDAGSAIFQFGDNLTSSSSIGLTTGILDVNNKNVQSTIFGSANSNVREVRLGSGTWTLTASGTNVWQVSISTNMTMSAGTSTIKMTDATSTNKTFEGGGLTYYTLYFSGAGTGTFTIKGSNTFNEIKVDTPPHTILFEPGTTNTASVWTISGTAGNLNTINSTTTATHNLVKVGFPLVSVDYVNVQHSIVSPSFYAGTHSTNNQGVATAGSGWIFTAPVSGGLMAFF